MRRPLRPLARILDARARGENPDAIERENRRLRGEATRDRARQLAEGRLLIMLVLFLAAFLTVGLRMGSLAAARPEEPTSDGYHEKIYSARANIVDDRGRVLATNLLTHALYAQPPMMIDPKGTVDKLMKIFPDLDRDRLMRDFTSGKRKFVWIRKRVSPEQMQAVHDIGDPGLLFGPRAMRLYPNGHLAAHILGGARYGAEGVSSAEILGVAGIEREYDDWLRDPANAGKALRLSIDVSIQAALEDVLAGGMKLMNARGATAVLMRVRTGEIVAMASLPDFDPNDRPAPLLKGDPSDSPLFNRAVQGMYELGSTFKTFAVAEALQLEQVTPTTMIDATPFRFGGFTIHDFHDYGKRLSVTDVLVHSSNIGTAHIVQKIGPELQKQFLGKLGLLEPTPVELIEAPTGRPILPRKWSEISAMTIGYGHGLAVSPLHLAAAYATIANDGRRVLPTLIAKGGPRNPVRQDYGAPEGVQVVSPSVARKVLAMMRAVVTRGTASYADVKGYQVAGKTGTADKPDPQGGYYDSKVIATFAGVFPVTDPQYVMVLSLDEPSDISGKVPRRTAGWTAVPVASEAIRRVAPLLGLRPEAATPESLDGIQLVQKD